MYRYITAAAIALICTAAAASPEKCTVAVYEGLVHDAKSADSDRQWDRSVELYRKILSDCPALIRDNDQVKAYDGLAVGLMMQGNHSAAIDTSKKCLELDPKYSACMMTAAKAYEELGDRGMAIQYANAAVEIGGYDDYSSAVVIYARDFLKRITRKQP
jgi:tetratricopeptide (TPR) repeat protein